ncbi:Crossover junction endonuclease eme1 [Cytospora mali]|uniref:Crossover junction endonuclease eme1 n=1 Tax=Cytospora mali TaxID=578113 RepID=A0A194WC24_CYTMA|nr:Crossover junction endonuclease eme1 [Valsa mali]
MPVEVIDLCSSPEAPLPPRTTASTVAPTQSRTKPTSRQLPPPARALDYVDDDDDDDDVFDLTNIDDNDFSFLPAPRANPAPKRPSPKASRSDDFLVPSDDFDTTFDPVNVASGPFDHRPSKKPRISGEPSTIARAPNNNDNSRSIQRSTSAAEKTSVGGPAVLQPAGLKRWSTTFDPIQTTSSPLAPISSNTRSSVSSDPFASSPRPAEKIFDLSKDDADPFGSPPQATEEENMVSNPSRKRAASPGVLGNSPQRTRSKAPAPPRGPVGWDHISSSAPEASFRDDDDWDLDVQPSRSGFTRTRSDGIDLGDLADLPGSSDDEEFPDIGSITKPTRSRSSSYRPKTGTVSRASVTKSSTSTTKMTAEQKAVIREVEKRRKQQEKDEAKEKRRQEKEKAAALASVNKVRTNKNVSTPEMLVDLPTSMNPSIRLQVETLLDDLAVKHHPYSSPVKNVVKWRRRVRARFNEEAGYWEPIQQERIEPERHAMVLMTAPEFVELALGAKGSDLEAHVLQVQRHYEDHAIIYLIEGLTPWMRKNRNVRNRQFQSAVRNVGADAVDTATSTSTILPPPPPPPSSQAQAAGRKKKDPKPPPQYIDEDAVEDALLQLQVAHGAKIHHTAAAVETAQWVAIFTQHISTIPYRRQKDAINESAAFCMESGQVRTGDSAADTYARMLQEIARVTAPIAYGIAGEFPTVAALVRGLEAGGPLVLEGIRKSANKDGAFTDRTIGPAVSRRLHKVFLGLDEASTDI